MLCLYVLGASTISIEAINNLKKFCEQYLAGVYELTVVDVYQQPERAAAEHVVAVPMLVKQSPHPLRRLMGNLSNTTRMLHVLGVSTPGRGVADHG